MAQEKRTFEASDDHIDELQHLALLTDSRASRGPSAGAVTWRVLIKRIAELSMEGKQPLNLEVFEDPSPQKAPQARA